MRARLIVAALTVFVGLLGFTVGGLVASAQTEYVYITEYDEAEQTVTPYTGGAKVFTGPAEVSDRLVPS